MTAFLRPKSVATPPDLLVFSTTFARAGKKTGKVEEVGKTRRSPDLPTHWKRKEKNYEEGKEREAEGIGHAKRVA